MAFPASIDLGALDGTSGFRLDGAAAGDLSGASVAAAGDVNGDGYADLIIGAKGADVKGGDSGASYVVFGKGAGFSASLDLSTLNGTNGFRLNGAAAGDQAGVSVGSAGDVNNDGYADLIVGAWSADLHGVNSGAAYVVFGKASGFAASLDLSALNGTNGFRLEGASAVDLAGISVASAGDVNGDGYTELLIGARAADPNGPDSGASYVVFGKASGFAASLDLGALDGTNGFRVAGVAAVDLSGRSVASAGDVNGDGYADLLIGAYGADSNGASSNGASYVVFGKASSFTASLDLSTLNGTNGFRLNGVAANDASGISVASAGDVNGDGFADLIVGASSANGTGASYVVFGKASGFAASLDLSTLDGTNGFRLNGAAAGDRAGRSVASAGDVNGDGYADLFVGAWGADPHGSNSGAGYVVFGKPSGFTASLNLSTLNGTNGFRLDGAIADSWTGFAVASAGDVNGDGYADLLIGAYGADTKGADSGASYVVFGGRAVIFGGSGDDRLVGSAGTDTLHGLDGNDTLRGGSGADLMVGGAGDDVYYADDAGDVVVEGANQGTDTVRTSLSSYTLGADVENLGFLGTGGFSGTGNGLANILAGGSGDDTLLGLDGNDTLRGGAGVDLMAGGTGDDIYVVDDADDVVVEVANEGIDTVRTTLSFYTLGAQVETLRFSGTGDFNGTGNGLANTLAAGSGDDTLDGAAGKDTLNGGAGNDVLIGGLGADRLTGGAGEDVFLFRDALDSTHTSRDTIVDFAAGTDRLDLIQALSHGLNPLQTVVSVPMTIDAHSLVAFVANGNTVLYINDTGAVQSTSNASMEILLKGVTTLSNSDIDYIHLPREVEHLLV